MKKSKRMKKNYILLMTVIVICGLNQIKAQIGNSLHFDGVNDAINCGNDSSIQITGSNITLEAMVKFDSFKDDVWEGNIINKESDSPRAGYMLRAGGNGRINFNIGDGLWYELNTSANTISTDIWYHIAATYDGTNMKIYLNGTEVANENIPGINISNSTSNLTIGARTDDRHVNATIDEVRIWNVTRTSTEILDNIDNELSLPQTGLVAYYKFNQGTGGGNNSTETNLIDETGNNNGTLSGFALTGSNSNWVTESTLSTIDLNSSDITKVFPNPSSEYIQVCGLTDNEKYSIYNVLGAKISSGIISDYQKIDIRNFTNGLYFLKFENGNSIKFIKE